MNRIENDEIDIVAQPDLATVVALLQAQALPTEDLTQDHMRHFFVARRCADGALPIVGTVGAEVFAEQALLRSLAVSHHARGRGYGGALVDYIERYLQHAGVTDIYLLTTTAEQFFKRLGYTDAARTAAPTTIKQTREFAGLCPDDSAFLLKRLR